MVLVHSNQLLYFFNQQKNPHFTNIISTKNMGIAIPVHYYNTRNDSKI